jgi:recombinational DNA repair protein RecR
MSYICAMTMINCKVCNALSDTSSAQSCYICKATPRQMNLIHEVMELPVNEEVLRFVLSSLGFMPGSDASSAYYIFRIN